MSNIDVYRGQIEKILADTGGGTYRAEIIDQGLRQALGLYSRQKPITAIELVTLASDGREIDISSIDGVISVSRAWVPYNASSPANPPLYRKFEHWEDDDILYIQDHYPSTGEVARIWTKKARTILDLDGATVTNVNPEDEAMLLDAASAYAIMAESTIGVDEVSIDAPETRSSYLFEIAKYKLENWYTWLGLNKDGTPISGTIPDGGSGTSGKGVKTKRLFHTDLYTDEPTIPDWDV